jgi:hypothetical protein
LNGRDGRQRENNSSANDVQNSVHRAIGFCDGLVHEPD